MKLRKFVKLSRKLEKEEKGLEDVRPELTCYMVTEIVSNILFLWTLAAENNRTPKEAWQNHRESQLGLAFQGISWKECKLSQRSLAFSLAMQGCGA